MAFKKGPTYFRIISADTYPEEVWKIHPKKEYCLEVSNLGRVRDLNTKAFLGYINPSGYVALKRYSNTLLVHRLVMETFQPREDSNLYYVDHINGIRSDNNLTNLRWVKATENLIFRNENWQDFSEIITKLVEKYGYEGTKEHLNSLL